MEGDVTRLLLAVAACLLCLIWLMIETRALSREMDEIRQELRSIAGSQPEEGEE